jgi:hypothetical protein
VYRFWDSVIEPLLRAADARVAIEVGAEQGWLTERLLEFCDERDGIAHVVEPVPHFLPDHWRRRYGARYVLHEELSLEALPRVHDPDAVLLDGDHNWFTVYHELEVVETLRRDGRFPIVVLHDVGWPYGRRDMYHDPSTVPDEFRHPSRRLGMRPGQSELLEEGGFNAHLENAVHEGGARNGVRTAVEDFCAASGHELDVIEVPGLHGLGVLVASRELEASPALAGAVERLRSGDFLLEHLRYVEDYWLRYVS